MLICVMKNVVLNNKSGQLNRKNCSWIFTGRGGRKELKIDTDLIPVHGSVQETTPVSDFLQDGEICATGDVFQPAKMF